MTKRSIEKNIYNQFIDVHNTHLPTLRMVYPVADAVLLNRRKVKFSQAYKEVGVRKKRV